MYPFAFVVFVQGSGDPEAELSVVHSCPLGELAHNFEVVMTIMPRRSLEWFEDVNCFPSGLKDTRSKVRSVTSRLTHLRCYRFSLRGYEPRGLAFI